MKQEPMLLMGDSGRLYQSEKKLLRIGICSRFVGNGISNRTRHFIIIDYKNGIKLEDIIKELGRIKTKFDHPDYYVFQTSCDGYCSLCFKSITWTEYKKVLNYSKLICIGFKRYAFRRGYTTLRITIKPDKNDSCLKLVWVQNSKNGVTVCNKSENRELKNQVFRLMKLEGVKI